MNQFKTKLENSPVLLRATPFIVFAVLTFFQGKLGESSRYWLYFTKTVLGAWMLLVIWPYVAEMRWKISWEAVVVGVFIFIVWVGIDKFYRHLGSTDLPWNPHQPFGQNSKLAWFFILMRLIGSTFIVPPVEEIFYRSFLYRYLIQQNFLAIPLNQFRWGAFLITSIVFGFSHHEWLAGIICGMAYQWLVLRKNRLGDAVTAHAITNFLLGSWIIWKGDWKFW